MTTREDQYRLPVSDPEAFAHVLKGLREPQSLAEIAAKQNVDGSVLEPLLEALANDAVLLDINAAQESQNDVDAAQAMLREARFWARTVFDQSFWEDLLAGRFTRAQVLGWGVEFYHFVDAANFYMPLGVANTRHARHLREAITRHYIQEMDHGAIFLEGLARSGLDRSSILIAPPLPHTQALINGLAELAIEGELPYTAAFAVMQPGITEPSVKALDEFYGTLSSLYPFAAPMFDAFRRHARIDVELHHEETTFTLLCQAGITPKERGRASLAMQTVAENFVLFFEGIQDWYGKQGDFSLRRPMVAGVPA
ncbi:iron-containing redox enzyme family protein [Lysobacter tyrosinilyticus]